MFFCVKYVIKKTAQKDLKTEFITNVSELVYFPLSNKSFILGQFAPDRDFHWSITGFETVTT